MLARTARRAYGRSIDLHVGARLRERRIILGMTQDQLAALIGVTFQQEHKYEKGINRVSAGRLYGLAQALRVDVSYFFEGLDTTGGFVPSPRQRMLLDLTRNFLDIPDRRHQEAIAALARALSDGGENERAA